MLASIAWKNVWRNGRRSGIMVVAIALGLWGGLFSAGVVSGLYDSLLRSTIDRSLGHLQIHAKGFQVEHLVSDVVPQADSIASAVSAIPGVKAVSARAVIEGMASSPTTADGVIIVGIDPERERNVTSICQRIVEGTYFGGKTPLPIVVGRKLAERLGLKYHAKMVLSFQRPDTTIVYGAFRIVGIYDSESAAFDGTNVFVRNSDLAAIAGQPLIHEIAIRLDASDSSTAFSRRLATLLPGLVVQTWLDLAPQLRLVESSDIIMVILLGVILLALMFGITNTMLMSVMDRVKELGVLMAIGMKRRRIFMMITVETFFLSVTGAIVGAALGASSIAWFARSGINLSYFSDGLSRYGFSSTLIPMLHPWLYPELGIMVIVTALAAAIYPAMKAIHLKPARALATIG